jgi:type IV pilus biogenesis protein CpaD/CtpE
VAYKASITIVVALLLAACAARPPSGTEATISRSGGKGHDWKTVTEAEVAAEIDANLIKPAKDFVKLRKDGEIVFCKRVREVGSNIPTLKCITQAQLRVQVEDMDQYRKGMRTIGKCPLGPMGCSAGQ